MDDFALGVQIMKAFKNLLHNKLDIVQRDALVIATNDELEEIMTQDLKNHANVSSVDTADLEIVQKLDAPFAERIRFITFSHLKKEKGEKDYVLGYYNRDHILDGGIINHRETS